MQLTTQDAPLFLLGSPLWRRGVLCGVSQGLDPLVLGKAPSALRHLHPTFVMSHKIVNLASALQDAVGRIEPGSVYNFPYLGDSGKESLFFVSRH
jgi:hypothetical protein